METSFKDGRFECTYHNPVTSEFEFLVSRITYHTRSDLRFILEGRLDAGFLFQRKGGKYLAKFNSGKSSKDPRKQIAEIRGQLLKYSTKFGIGKDRIFMLLPAFVLVHRKIPVDN